MASNQYRKFLLTINNPLDKGFTHEAIKLILFSMNITYFCLVDEIATTGTPHTHVFLYRASAIRINTIQKRFPNIHYDICNGLCQESKDYLLKSGKWENSEKSDTTVPGTFEEYGEIPTANEEKSPTLYSIVDDIESGKSTAEIIKKNPKLAFKSNDINVLRETLVSEANITKQRELDVYYLFGPTGVGKTRSVFTKHDASSICRITNYNQVNGIRFDSYHGQSVLVFEEFHSQIPIYDMLNYLDRYPVSLPARYSDRTACYKTVYITSNTPLMNQYLSVQKKYPEVWAAFIRRINHIIEFLPDGSAVERCGSFE